MSPSNARSAATAPEGAPSPANPIAASTPDAADPAMLPPLLSWSQAASAGTAVVGGKGWSLGRLARYGFPVPDGAVLVAMAYREHLAAARLDAALAALADVPAEAADATETVARLDAIRDTILATPLPSPVVDAVAELLERGSLAGRPLAVRSSATAEDSAEASFAGIHESVLNVVGVPAILDAIRRCYASLWAPRALAYRRRMGIADDAVACAVVLCALVGRAAPSSDPYQPPVAAGVAFTADPRTGRRDRIIINAAPGLGEALVSGHVNPAEIEVEVGDGGPVMVARRGGYDGLVDDAQALTLARLVLRVHWSLGEGQDPRDIEWAHDGERFWLVQARPIARLPRVTPDVVRTLPVIWSNANLKDAVAGVPSALGYSILQPILRAILYTHVQLVGGIVPPGMETIRRIDGRAYFDLTSMEWLMYDSLGVTPSELNQSLGGMQPEIPVPGDPLKGPKSRRRKLARLRLLKLLWQSARIYEREIGLVRAEVRSRSRDDLSGLSNAEIVAWRDRSADDAMSFARLFAINNAGSFWDKQLSDLIDKLLPGTGPRITASLLAGSNEVVTAEHGYRLVDLARLAEVEPEARAYLKTTPLDPWGWRTLPATSPFRRAFEQFLDEFGHRGVYEVEIANPRWSEDPTYLLDQIRAFLDQHQVVGDRGRAVARRQAAEREVRTLPLWSRPLVGWLASRARRAAALREAGKSAIVASMVMTRMLTAELGARMTKAGLLDRPDDIFHLCWWEILAWAQGEWDGTGARALAEDRAAQRAAWVALDPPDVIVLDADGRPATLPDRIVALAPRAEDARAGSGAGETGVRLSGLAVSSGRARGVARIIRHPTEGSRLQPGDVLVAPSTDPAWTPLFLRASAVVMEVGGYLSHGAIVAREYGLPAVVNVPNALTTIRDGQLLAVDGDTGEVLILPA